MPIYLTPSGKILTVSGKPSLASGCCCAITDSSCPNPDKSCVNEVVAKHLQVTVSGTSYDGSCSNCSTLNGTYVIPYSNAINDSSRYNFYNDATNAGFCDTNNWAAVCEYRWDGSSTTASLFCSNCGGSLTRTVQISFDIYAARLSSGNYAIFADLSWGAAGTTCVNGDSEFITSQGSAYNCDSLNTTISLTCYNSNVTTANSSCRMTAGSITIVAL
jgi:hypothetical protein